MGIYIAGELIPAANLPDFKATIPGGGTKFKVTVTSRAAFSAAQTRACVLGSTVTIGANGVDYTGTITGFGCREGYGLCQIEEATITMNVGGQGITIGPSPSNDYVTSGVDDIVQFDAAWDELRSDGGGLICIEEGTYDLGDTWVLDNEVDPVSWQIVGSGHATKMVGPPSSPIIMIKNGIMNNRKNSISNIWLSGPSTSSPSSVGIDHDGAECETNLHDVMVSNCTIGIDMRSPSAYNLRLDNVFTKSCLVGLQIKGQNNIIKGAITGYDPLSGSSIGIWVEGETSGNTLISCDGGTANIGIKVTGVGNTLLSSWYDENTNTSIQIDGMSTRVIGGFFPTGSIVNVTANAHYSVLDHIFSYYGRPTTTIDSGVVGVQVIDSYFGDYPSKITNEGSYTGFSRPVTAPSAPALSGIQGMVIWNSAASAGGPPGWVCTVTGDEGSAVWKALPNLEE